MLVVFAVLAATIGTVAYVSLHGFCSNPNGMQDLQIVAAPPPKWTEQASLTIDVNSSRLTTTVLVSSSQDSEGYGPAYLLNGVSDAGYWYQLGLAFHWGAGNGYATGAQLLTAVFSPNNPYVPVYQWDQGVDVRSGDQVTLSMTVLPDCMSLALTDSSTHVGLVENYSLEGSDHFSSAQPQSTPIGFFCGLMTEWWHVDPYYGPTGYAEYSLPQRSGNFAGLGVQERIPVAGGALLFSNATRVNLGLPTTWTFSAHNVTESLNQTEFVTG